MSEILLLNKISVDLSPKPITRKLQIGDIGDISSRKSTFSYTVKLPMTSRNIVTLEMLGVNGNNSRKPFENVVADYIVDGIPLIINGYVIIKRTSDFFELNIYNGIIDLSEKIKGKKISELEMSDLNHFLTSQNYIESFSNTEGFIYGLANFGLGISTAIKVEKNAPSIFVHTIFRKILQEAGINLVGEFFTDNVDFLNEVIPPSRGFEIVDEGFTSTSKGSISSSTVSDYQNSSNYISTTKTFSVSGSVTGASVSGSEITFSVAGTYRIAMTVNYRAYKTSVSIGVLINGSRKGSVYLDKGNSLTKTAEVNFVVQVGDKVSFNVCAYSDYPDSYFNSFDSEDGIFERFEVSYSASLTGQIFLQEGGQFIQASDYISDINQIDFIKDIINRYGLVLHPISNTSDYRFRRLERILNDREGSEDWTSKLVQGVIPEEYVSGYAKANYLKYLYPEEIVVPNNDGSIDIENENAASEKTIYTSIFEIPNRSGSIFGEQTYSIPIWETVDSIVENRETPAKVLKIKRIEGSVNAKLFSEVGGVDFTGGVPVLTLQDMSMNYFIGNYFKGFRNLINDFKQVEMMLNLSLIDIFNMDFFKLKFFKQTGRFYYLQSVQHTPEKLSKVNLLELSTFSVNEPPSAIGDYSFEMNSGSTRTISVSNLLKGYVDPETDPALKVKFISGFSEDLILTNDGEIINEETEILVSNLVLEVFDSVGGLEPYDNEWIFDVADEGSGNYSGITGTLKASVKELVNTPPNAIASSESTVTIEPNIPYPSRYVTLNGSSSFDSTGDIVSFLWEIQSKPSDSNAVISNKTSVTGYLVIPNEFESSGNYAIRLTVTDEYGASDTDTVNIFVNLDFKELD